MIFEELSRISNGNFTSKNPHPKLKPRRLRRAEAKQARLEAKKLGTAVNKNISTTSDTKKVI